MPRPARVPQAARKRSSKLRLDRFAIIPLLACCFSLIASPLLLLTCASDDMRCLTESRIENKLFWPALGVITVALAARNWFRSGKPVIPPHIVCLFLYLGFAGATVIWAFKPEVSLIRYIQQAMIIVSIVIPAILANRSADLMRGVFLCFAISAVLNLIFVLGQTPINIKHATPGFPGYFAGKNYLGECAALAILLSLHELCYSGFRRVLGAIILIIAVALVFYSNSKTSLGLALLAPCLAAVVLFMRRTMRLSPIVLPLTIVFCYLVLSGVSNFNMNRISYMLYGDSTFTGRQIIWDFAHIEIARRPLLGWGYQSFWLVGPDAPSIVDAPGWVKNMPNAHSGYYDTILELGYVGFTLLLAFVVTTVHAMGRAADREPVRAWLLLSLAFFVMIYNGLESTWMRGFEFMWIVFVIVAAETARYYQPSWSAGRPPQTRRLAPGARHAGRGAGRRLAASSMRA